MIFRSLLSTTAVALIAVGLAGWSAPAHAQFAVQTVVEDPAFGYFGAIPTSQPPILLFSDGDVPQDPFQLGFFYSDAIQLNDSWAPDPASNGFGPGGWTQAPGTSIWTLTEGTGVEPVGRWIFLPGSGWQPGTMSVAMREVDGSLSDFIRVANDGPNGSASITFQSGNFGVPEPGMWALMLIGFGGMGMALRSRRKAELLLA